MTLTFPVSPRSPRIARASLSLCMLAISLAATACQGDGQGLTLAFTESDPELAGASVDAAGVWESAPWDDDRFPWLPYPGLATLRLQHSLARVPRSVLVYIAFASDGAAPALAAGELARVLEVSPDSITIRNDTQSELFARVIAY